MTTAVARSGPLTYSQPMPRIGAWWLRGQPAEEGETVEWSQLANRSQSRNRAVGGKLFLTDRRLLFCPHWVDAAFGGKTWNCGRAQVRAVGTEPKSGGLGGGMRDRLRIEVAGGGVELFVVKDLDRVVDNLRAAVGGGDAGAAADS
jgi:hypothetical protein